MKSDAYAAGIIDGEGCVTLTLTKLGTPGCRVEVGMTVKARAVLEWMQATYGGHLRRTRAESKKWAESWAWGVYGDQAELFLEKIANFLILKRPQAEVISRFRRLKMEQPRYPAGERVRWSAEGRSLVKGMHQQIQEFNQKGPFPVTSGNWFARRVGDHWVTPQSDLMSPLGSELFSGRWPTSGTMRNGQCTAQATWAPRTDGSGSGSSPTWQTPVADDAVERVRGKFNSRGEPKLSAEVQMWPTPRASPNQNRSTGASPSHVAGTHGWNLAAAAHDSLSPEPNRLWPTPKANEDAAGTIHGKMQRMLTHAAKESDLSGTATGGQLNPTWVEWLMGYPLGWTVCAGWATRSSRRERSRSSGGSPKSTPSGTIPGEGA